MSRKWERMIKKNTKTVNKNRVRHGKPTLSQSASDGTVTFKGRNWILSLFLFCVGIFCYVAFRNTYQEDNLYWITGGSYIVLSLFMFAFRRPFLKIGKSTLGTRRFTGDRRVEAAEIKEIITTPNSVLISFKSNKGKWGFTRLYHRMDVGAMSEKLKEFAASNAVVLKQE